MKKTKSFFGALLLTLSIFFSLTNNVSSEARTFAESQDKEAVDCGTWWGTKCVPNGDACVAKACDDNISAIR